MPAPSRLTLLRTLGTLLALAALLPLNSCKGTEESTDRATMKGPPVGAGASGAAATAFDTPRKAEGKISIRILTNGISPFWDSMQVGMKRTADELGCDAGWAAPSGSQSVNQIRLLDDTVSKGVDGIAISAIEGAAITPTIDGIVTDKKIPVITMDSDAPASKRLCYIGTNNTEAGKRAGEEAIRLLPSGGKFIAFVGNLSAENARERRDGFLEAVKGRNIEILDVMEDNKDVTRAKRNVEDAILKHGDKIQGLLGLYSYNAPAIAEAVKAKGLKDKLKVITFDAEPGAQTALEEGLIDATIVQKPYEFGALSTRLLFLINRKGWPEARKELKIPDNGIYDTGVEVVTPQNIKEFRQKLNELGVTSS